MTTQFYSRFKDYSQEQLFNMVLNADDYQAEALTVARQIIKEKGWTNDLDKQIEEINKKKLEEEDIEQQEIIEKAEYYKNIVKFKNDNNSFQIRIADIPRFEGVLVKEGIEFFREDKNIGVQLDSYPTQTYFFLNKDVERVDEISKKLRLVTAPYNDIKPFIKFEIKVLFIAILFTILLIILLK